MERIPITVAGAEKLKAELDHLRRVDRPEVVAAIEEARSKGDLSENAEYDAAREKQSFIEGRIALLEGRIPALQVIDPKTLNAGSKVETDKEVTYQVVGVDETDIEHNKVSVSSPIARALIGKSEGDEVVVHAPRGDIDYEILSVRYI